MLIPTMKLFYLLNNQSIIKHIYTYSVVRVNNKTYTIDKSIIKKIFAESEEFKQYNTICEYEWEHCNEIYDEMISRYFIRI